MASSNRQSILAYSSRWRRECAGYRGGISSFGQTATKQMLESPEGISEVERKRLKEFNSSIKWKDNLVKRNGLVSKLFTERLVASIMKPLGRQWIPSGKLLSTLSSMILSTWIGRDCFVRFCLAAPIFLSSKKEGPYEAARTRKTKIEFLRSFVQMPPGQSRCLCRS